ncbi:MAG: hypothetical protein EHM19_05655 [Candidatus Latescibacterota bacterium]|nr:MAG: hypothetical protein EHM19_05655 [Candidatus Latescibacterota bacterium]
MREDWKAGGTPRAGSGARAHFGALSTFCLALGLLVLSASIVRGEGEAATGAEPRAYRSRFEAGLGFVRALEGESRETHLAVGASARTNLGERLSLGLECGSGSLEEGDRGSSFGVIQITPFAEYRLRARGAAIPFVAGGAGYYAWRWCDGAGDGIYACSNPFPDRSKGSFGAWIGTGIHAGLSGSRSVSASVQVHPVSTFEGGRSFLRLIGAFGL